MIFDVIFSEFFGWEWRTLAILRQNPNEIAVLYGCGFGLKNLGLGQTPQLLPKIRFEGSPQFTYKSSCFIHTFYILLYTSNGRIGQFGHKAFPS